MGNDHYHKKVVYNCPHCNTCNETNNTNKKQRCLFCGKKVELELKKNGNGRNSVIKVLKVSRRLV